MQLRIDDIYRGRPPAYTAAAGQPHTQLYAIKYNLTIEAHGAHTFQVQTNDFDDIMQIQVYQPTPLMWVYNDHIHRRHIQ